VLTLSSGALTIDLLPEWGGKIISLQTEPDGYDFMAPAPFGAHAPDPAVLSPNDAYGWDEMFPGCLPESHPPGLWGDEELDDNVSTVLPEIETRTYQWNDADTTS
jgi:hypothetical protein